VAESLITSKGTDANDLAKRFWTEYTNEPWRGYGQNVVQVFKKLKVNSKLSSDMDPFLPASEQVLDVFQHNFFTPIVGLLYYSLMAKGPTEMVLQCESIRWVSFLATSIL